MQLNFFEHGRDTMLRNDVVAALERRDPKAAAAAMKQHLKSVEHAIAMLRPVHADYFIGEP